MQTQRSVLQNSLPKTVAHMCQNFEPKLSLIFVGKLVPYENWTVCNNPCKRNCVEAYVTQGKHFLYKSYHMKDLAAWEQQRKPDFIHRTKIIHRAKEKMCKRVDTPVFSPFHLHKFLPYNQARETLGKTGWQK